MTSSPVRALSSFAPAARRAPMAVLAVLAAVLAACTGARRAVPPADGRAPIQEPPTDATFDWHGLLAAPLGSALKDVPLMLHEVLLFQDEAHGGGRGGARSEESECYASDAPAPRWVGRTPEDYLLCFQQDRLARIQATVRLPMDKAADIFSAACTLWSKGADPKAAVACEGRDGAVHYRGRLEFDPDSAAGLMSIVLDGSAEPQ